METLIKLLYTDPDAKLEMGENDLIRDARELLAD